MMSSPLYRYGVRLSFRIVAVSIAVFAFVYLVLNFNREPVSGLADDTVEVVYFTADPDTVERNGEITLRWHVRGVDTVTLQVRYGSYKQAPNDEFIDLPAEAELTYDLTRSAADDPLAVPYIHNVDFWLLVADPDRADAAWTPGYAFLDSTQVQIICPYEGFFFGDSPYHNLCPLAEAQPVETVYQPFELGFLLWRSDNNTIYVFRTLPDNPLSVGGSALRFTEQIPLEMPAGGFGEFLDENRLHGIIMGIGEVSAPAATYEAIVQDTYGDTFHSAISYISLPDEQVIGYQENIYGASWYCVSCAD